MLQRHEFPFSERGDQPPEPPPLTPREVADGLRRSGKDPAEIRKRLQHLRAAIEASGSPSDNPNDRPPGISPEEWEEYLALRDDERRQRERGEGLGSGEL